MCGIVGYIGKQAAIPLIIAGLEKLEYRGYDSAGVAVIRDNKIDVVRAVGKLIELKKSLGSKIYEDSATVGIGHTRWATHGRPSETNAHPHTSGRVSLIHNGIIENYAELRIELETEGRIFKSETDTEIGAHLLARELERGLEPFQALKKACSLIRGSYAFVALDSDNPDRLLVAKNATPIILGVGEGEMFVASDIPAVLNSTRKIIVLEDGDLAEISADSIKIENSDQPQNREILNITWDPVTAQKGGFKHFMLKEIHEQTTVIGECFRGRVALGSHQINIPELNLSDADIKNIERIVLVACGTAWHACLMAKFYLEFFARIPCDVDYASEFRYRDPVLNENTLVIAISQSGETADTLAAIEHVIKNSKAKTLAICNVLGSSLARKVQHLIFTQAGPEISVASTKAFTTMLVASYLLAVHIAKVRQTLAPEVLSGLIDDLLKLPTAIETALNCEEQIQKIAKEFYTARDFLFLGRGLCYPTALEGALKLKEISYIHAEGYPAGEMKHGPIALIDENMPVVNVLQRSERMFEKAKSNLKEVEARGGRIISFTDAVNTKELKDISPYVVELPFVSDYLSPIILTIPMQLLAYYVAVANGTDVDLPRNLAKSVTVE
jgi:glucosamine--fructose-6-phosphate aminotransferase (isomerizing)